jgi:Dullard-like phosphatase family protein
MSLDTTTKTRQSHSLTPERQELRQKLFNPLENEAVSPKKYYPKFKKSLKEFKKQASKLNFYPLGSRENYPGNYDNYVQMTLSHIQKINKLKFEYALEDKIIYKGVPDYSNQKNNGKKILLLDLDETLIHADFNGEFANDKTNKYDTVIKFQETESDFEESNEENEEFYSKRKIKLEKIEEVKKEYRVGIFVRRGAKQFLAEVSKYFEVGIFTASVKEYADAVIDYLDPHKNMIKFRLYRNNCINVNDRIYVKDLRILKGVDLKDILLIDNSMYSFTAQLANGILINSFYNDKNDIELYNVLGYLLNFLLKVDDVRMINEQFFNFQKISNDLGEN